jgi:hypothetical protein
MINYEEIVCLPLFFNLGACSRRAADTQGSRGAWRFRG